MLFALKNAKKRKTLRVLKYVVPYFFNNVAYTSGKTGFKLSLLSYMNSN